MSWGNFSVYFLKHYTMPYPSKGWRPIFIALEAALPLSLLPVPPPPTVLPSPLSLQPLLLLARILVPRRPRPPVGAAHSKWPSVGTWWACEGSLRVEEAVSDERLLV